MGSTDDTPRITGPWSASGIESFLNDVKIPMRLAANTSSGFPVVLSLWYAFEDGALLAAVHESSKIASRLAADPRCAFEVAPNEPPYRGVRGRGEAALETEGGGELLERLLTRYLGGTDSSLATFLLGRAASELVIRITPSSLDSWDYSERMRGTY